MRKGRKSEDWKVEKLDDVCRIEMGKTPPRGNKKYWDIDKATSNIWLSIADLNNTDGKVVFDSKEYISREGAKLCKTVKKGTLLVSFKLTLGRLAFAGRDLYTNEAIAALSIKDEKKLSKDFLYWYLSFFDWDEATGGDVKVKGKTLNKEKLKQIPIPIPPFLEQQRIMSMLDEIIASITQAIANAERNLVNAYELFESEMEDMFENTPNGWNENKLGEVCEFEGGSQPPKSTFSKVEKDGYVRLIQIRDYKTDNHKVYIPLSKARRFCKKNDIMIGRYGPPVFQILEGLDGAYNVALMKAVPNKEKVTRDYIFLFLKHRKIQQHIINLSQRASGQTGISIDALTAFPIRFPSIAEQRVIVGRLEALSAETRRLEEIYQQKVESLEELKRSVLAKAFAGEL